jgi:hypothetical protein
MRCNRLVKELRDRAPLQAQGLHNGQNALHEAAGNGPLAAKRTATRSTTRDRGKSSAIDGCGVNRFEEGGCCDCWQPRQFMAAATIHGKQVSGSCVTQWGQR